MATYAVGDLQGCLDELRDLLDLVSFSSTDRLWLVGDLVNRGPKSLETLRFVRSLEGQTTVVLGNHDLHLLAIYHVDAHQPSKSDTYEEILNAPDVDDLMGWLARQKLLYTEREWVMTHAGLPPMWDVPQASALAAEVETALRDEDPVISRLDFFTHMYGNLPDRWSEDLVGLDRLRAITNYLTRMRLIRADGQMNFSHKGRLQDAPEGWDAWFVHCATMFDGYRIVFGHWAALDGHTGVDSIYALDTGCVWGRKMTAMRLEDRRLFAVNARC
ncbi:MAG: symmetrical bis(5'-nucleosyl)-tetraphosphatase [Pseudomonadota bacterium]